MNDTAFDHWAAFPWFEQYTCKHVHPDDVEIAQSIRPGGKVVRVLPSRGDYATVEYRGAQLRAKPELLRKVPAPAFCYGEVVSFIKSGQAVNGTIYDIVWHLKERVPILFVELNGKVLKRQYWSTDLHRV